MIPPGRGEENITNQVITNYFPSPKLPQFENTPNNPNFSFTLSFEK
jgi:hypothetical protein